MPAIILNGTSSSGKTSIAKAIQQAATVPFLHIALDDFLSMFRLDAIRDPELQRECYLAGISNLHNSLPSLLSGKFPGVIDHVFDNDSRYQDCLAALESELIIVVGVHCPLGTLRDREVLRGNRRVGLAETQFPIVHKNRTYDLEVDTSLLSSEECASLILKAFHDKQAELNPQDLNAEAHLT